MPGYPGLFRFSPFCLWAPQLCGSAILNCCSGPLSNLNPELCCIDKVQTALKMEQWLFKMTLKWEKTTWTGHLWLSLTALMVERYVRMVGVCGTVKGSYSRGPKVNTMTSDDLCMLSTAGDIWIRERANSVLPPPTQGRLNIHTHRCMHTSMHAP